MGAEAEGLEDIGTRADAGVEENGHSIADGVDDLGEDFERADCTVELAAYRQRGRYPCQPLLLGLM